MYALCDICKHADVFMIVSRGIDVKEMFKVWKNNSLLSKEEFQGSKDLVRSEMLDTEEAESKYLGRATYEDADVLASRTSGGVGAAGKGALRTALAKERMTRSAVVGHDRVMSRNGRLGGVYTMKSSFQPTRNLMDVDGEAAGDGLADSGAGVGGSGLGLANGAAAIDGSGKVAVKDEVKLIVKNPFAISEVAAPQAQRKRAKKNLTFAKVFIIQLWSASSWSSSSRLTM